MVDIIVIAAVGAAIAGAFVGLMVFAYYKCFFKTGQVRETERVRSDVFAAVRQSRDVGWVDVSEYQGQQAARVQQNDPFGRPVSGRTSARLSADRRRSAERPRSARDSSQVVVAIPVNAQEEQQQRRSQRVSQRLSQRQDRTSTPSQQAEDIVLPTDLRMPTAEFKTVLKQFYAKWAPSLGVEELELAMSAYGGDSNGRAELDRSLQQEYGQGLDEFFVAKQSGTDGPASSRRSEDRIPSVRIER